MTPPLIALYSSAPRCGKSEVAKTLVANGYKVLKFASPLKDMIRSLARSAGHGEVEIEEMLEGSLKETPIPTLGFQTPRHLMQTLGTDWGREKVCQTLWTDLLIIRVQGLLKAGYGVVVDDMRFPNEYGCLRALGAKMWRVTRPGVVAKANHPSEGLLDTHQFDATIPNESDLKALQDKVYSFMPVTVAPPRTPRT